MNNAGVAVRIADTVHELVLGQFREDPEHLDDLSIRMTTRPDGWRDSGIGSGEATRQLALFPEGELTQLSTTTAPVATRPRTRSTGTRRPRALGEQLALPFGDDAVAADTRRSA